ncbi:hypothetical protein PG991_009203 [Apiospora marii]|uniref:Uncharacterized protein n=1 Tax=Apiospora marii TaxID=335849 RepID=A0ABR1RLA6_9PEZI
MDYDIPIGLLYASVAHRLIDLGEVRLQELPSHHAANQGSPIQSRLANRSFLPSWVPDWNVQLPQASVSMVSEKDVAGHREDMKPSDVLNDVLVVPLQRRPGRIERLRGLVPAWPIGTLGIEPLLREVLRPLRDYDDDGFMQLSQIPCSVHFEFLGAWLAHLRASLAMSIAKKLENEDAARERVDLNWLINMIQSTCQRNQAMRDESYDMRNHYDTSNNYNAYSYYRRKSKDNSTREWEKLLRIVLLARTNTKVYYTLFFHYYEDDKTCQAIKRSTLIYRC